MTEKEYIQLTNLQKITIAEFVLRDCFTGHKYGMKIQDFRKVMGIIVGWRNHLEKKIKVKT